MKKLSKRRKPYSEAGIRRVPCARCGAPSSQQWEICSLSNYWYGLCAECDVAINKLVMDFLQVDARNKIIKKYAERMGVEW